MTTASSIFSRKNAAARRLFDRAGLLTVLGALVLFIGGPALGERFHRIGDAPVYLTEIVAAAGLLVLAGALGVRKDGWLRLGFRSLGTPPIVFHPLFWAVSAALLLPLGKAPVPLVLSEMAWFVLGFWTVSRRNAAALSALATAVFFGTFHFSTGATPGFAAAGPLSVAAYLFSPLSSWLVFAALAALPNLLNLFGPANLTFLLQAGAMVALALFFRETRGRAGKLLLMTAVCGVALFCGLSLHVVVAAPEPSVVAFSHHGAAWAGPYTETDPTMSGAVTNGFRQILAAIGPAAFISLGLFLITLTVQTIWRGRRGPLNVVSLFWLSACLSAAIAALMDGGLERPLLGMTFWLSAGLAARGAHPRPLRPKGRWVFLVPDLKSGAVQRAVTNLIARTRAAHERVDVHVVVLELRGAFMHDVPAGLTVTPLFPKAKGKTRRAVQLAEWAVYQWIHRPERVLAFGRPASRLALLAAGFAPSPELLVVEISALGLREPVSTSPRLDRMLEMMADRVFAVPPGRERDLRRFLGVPERRASTWAEAVSTSSRRRGESAPIPR